MLLPAPTASSPSSDTSQPVLADSSPNPTPSPVKPHPDFTSKEYIGLATAVVNINPFGAKHGKKGTMWEEVATTVKSKGLFTKSSTDVIKNKMMALIKYQDVSCLLSFVRLALTFLMLLESRFWNWHQDFSGDECRRGYWYCSPS
jgi:hypothetical protein